MISHSYLIILNFEGYRTCEFIIMWDFDSAKIILGLPVRRNKAKG